MWEFPGGKIENNETVEQALFRELHEELNIKVSTAKALFCIKHSYMDKTVALYIYLVSSFDGKEQGMEQQEICWVTLKELKNYKFPAANQAIISYIEDNF